MARCWKVREKEAYRVLGARGRGEEEEDDTVVSNLLPVERDVSVRGVQLAVFALGFLCMLIGEYRLSKITRETETVEFDSEGDAYGYSSSPAQCNPDGRCPRPVCPPSSAAGRG
jgi:hypothetical protein